MENDLKIFDEVSQERPGYLNASEFETLLQRCGAPMLSGNGVKNFFRGVDMDGSGYVSRDEFVQVFTALNSENQIEVVKVLFRSYDKDRSGYLTIDEIHSLVCDFVQEIPIETLDAGFAELGISKMDFNQVYKLAFNQDIDYPVDPYEGCSRAEKQTDPPVETNDIEAAMAEIEREFNAADKGMDGKLSESEFTALAEKTNMNQVFAQITHRMFLGLDIDGSGYITKEEFMSTFRSILQNDMTAMAKILFRAYDADRSGRLDKTEVYNLLKEMGQEQSPEDIDQFMTQYSTNGTLSYANIVSFAFGTTIPDDSDPYDGLNRPKGPAKPKKTEEHHVDTKPEHPDKKKPEEKKSGCCLLL